MNYLMTENDLGFKIKKLREDRNMSQEELAIQLNISQSKLSKIENGRLQINTALLLGVCNCFGIELTDILG